MPEWLKLVVPGLAEQQGQFRLQRPAERRMARAVHLAQHADTVAGVPAGASPGRGPSGPAGPGRADGAADAASVIAARSLPSGTRMSPLAEVTAENVPRVGV